MSEFSDTWKSMSVEQRAQHIVRDWQDCRESNDPMVMRVAAVVAHAVLSEAIVELNTLRAERDKERRANAAWLANLAEMVEVDASDLQALIDAAWDRDSLVVRLSARDLWRMAGDRRGRDEP